MPLHEYRRKRDFKRTPEPRGKAVRRKGGGLRFVIQMHRATRLHFDLRLEMGGVYRSWAVTHEPTLSPLDQRLAIFVEDHPIDYGDFEGIIPRGNYGAGTVMLWDRGTYEERFNLGNPAAGEGAMLEGLEKGKLTFVLDGEKLKGEFALVQLKDRGNPKAWLLLKKRDAHASFKRPKGDAPAHRSVTTGRTLEEIASESEAARDVWIPGQGRLGGAKKAARRAKAAAPGAAAKALARPVVESLRAPKPPRASAPAAQRAYSPLASARLDAAAGDAGPTAAGMPRRVRPMLPAAEPELVERKGWFYTALTGGTRALAEVERGKVALHSRQLLPLGRRYPGVVDSLRAFVGEVLLDLEIDAESGRARAIDLLYADGEDLRECPLKLRLARLAKMRLPAGIEIAETREGRAPGRATQVLARDGASAYRPGVSSAWLKIARADPADRRARSAPAPEVALTSLDKVYWPDDGYTKGDVIEYYRKVAPFILPHLRDRPESLNRHPEGIDRPGFYQKDITGYKPRWVRTERVYSESSAKSIDYFVCDDERSLLYLANLGCIEINPWFSRVGSLDRPDWLVIDLDPDDNSFESVIEVAREVRAVLDAVGVESHVKTSGATGLHIAAPLGARYDYSEVVKFAERIARVVHARMPEITSVERSPGKRRHKIYLDILQNRRGQTLAAPYCLRPRPGAPVSTPLRWKELTPRLDPRDFDIRSAPKRFAKVGDLWLPVMGEGVSLPECSAALERLEKGPRAR